MILTAHRYVLQSAIHRIAWRYFVAVLRLALYLLLGSALGVVVATAVVMVVYSVINWFVSLFLS